uniref:Putative serine/threonine protein phosphatase 2a catalytic subunit n=1 Tax=Ixodes ricinus TaxID=34613 RepID=A0A0K8RHY0_IXORI
MTFVCLGFFLFRVRKCHLGVLVLRPGRARAKEVSRRFDGKPPPSRFLRDKRGGLGICNIRIARRTGDRSSETAAKVPGSCSLLCVFVAVLLFIAHSFQKERRTERFGLGTRFVPHLRTSRKRVLASTRLGHFFCVRTCSLFFSG